MLKKYQLKNGLEVILVESRKSPVLSIQMWVKTGSADEARGEEGISHFIEHLVFKGSRKYGVGEIAATVEGAGGELNAYTSFDQTVFYVTISKEFQSVGLDVIAEMMGFPTFDAAEIDNEREVVIEEIKRSNDSPHRQASRLLFSSVYRKHPYGIPVIGYAENIKEVSRDVLVDYYAGRYNPRNMTLLVVGDFKVAEMKAQVQKHFGQFEPNKLRKVKRAPVTVAKRPTVITETAPFKETILHLAFPSPKATHRDVVALEMFALILGQGESSRLNQRLRMNQHVVNYAGSSVFVAKDPGFFAVSVSLSPDDLPAALDGLGDEIVNALKQPCSAAELKKALTNLASEQLYSLETVDGLARNYGHYQDLFGDPKYFATFMKQAEALTPVDLLKVARKYLAAGNATLIVQTAAAKAEVEPRAKAWLKRLTTDLKTAAKTRVTTKVARHRRISFASRAPAGVRSEVERVTLANGITVITRPSFETPVVSLRAAALGGSRLEPVDRPGATELLSRVWTAGFGDLSELALNERIDEMAASLSAFGGRNSVGLSMTCLKPFADPMLELFAGTYRRPNFEEAAIDREVKAMLEHVKLRADNPAQICVLEFMRTMFGDHPYGRDTYGEPATISKLGAAEVRRAYGSRSGLTIVAAGAVVPAEFRARITELFAGETVAAGAPKPIPIAYPKTDQRVYRESVKEQSHLLMGYPGLTLKDQDRYVLQVIQAILAGQGGRLFLELRDKASLAYSVSPMRMEGLEGGYFGAYIGCSPEKVGKALGMMKDEFAKLVDQRVDDAELLRAQRYLIGKHDIDLQKNSNITSAILFDEIYGIDHLETYRYAERIRAVDAPAVQKLAARLFARPTVTSLVGPTCPW